MKNPIEDMTDQYSWDLKKCSIAYKKAMECPEIYEKHQIDDIKELITTCADKVLGEGILEIKFSDELGKVSIVHDRWGYMEF